VCLLLWCACGIWRATRMFLLWAVAMNLLPLAPALTMYMLHSVVGHHPPCSD
jgi:hypothetical protein